MSERREVIAGHRGGGGGSPGRVDARGDGGDGRGDLSVTAVQPDEPNEEARLRPRRLADFHGQPELTEHLGIILEAARRRSQPPDHILFAGPPGLGKTSLAGIVAGEMGAGMRITSGPSLVRGGDLAAILTDLQEGDVLFVDEVHRLPPTVEEILYPAMEEFKLDVILGKGPSARTIRIDVPRFSLIGATTRAGMLAGPLRDRFGFLGRLELYSPVALAGIVVRSAEILAIPLAGEAAVEIASRARGTPRIANRLLRRVRDYAEVRADGVVSLDVARSALELLRIDELGLDKIDRAILDALCTKFGGGPVGLTTLSQCVGEDPETLEDAYEPYLLQCGLLHRTPRGRVATALAFEHLGLPIAVAPSGALMLPGFAREP